MKVHVNFTIVKFVVDSLIDLLRYGGWQILFFIIFVKYKDDVRTVFIFFSKHISKFSIDKVSFEFENDVDKIQKEVGENSKIILQGNRQSDKDFSNLVSIRPDYAILDSWKDIEIELEKIFPGPVRQTITYIRELELNDILDAKDLSILNDLRRLRNKVVHETGMFISEKTARKYRNQCLYVIGRLEESRNKSA